MQATKSRLSIDVLTAGILNGERVTLAKAITLMESSLPSDEVLASELLEKIISHTGKSIRIGISGVPGVGKSTFIEVFGNLITGKGKKLAVLTIDPSSQLTKGSILGDKTRMPELSKNPLAFIRPTAAGHTLGGVHTKTREAMLLCEAAGFEVIIVETVGVGQSEVAVKNMVDFFLLLMLAGAGDELQGIKKGVTEMADAIVITKADGANLNHAKEAQSEYQHALQLLSATASEWKPKVLTASAHHREGIEETWSMINEHYHMMVSTGYFHKNRQQQNIAWMHESLNQLLRNEFNRFESLQHKLKELEEEVADRKIVPQKAAQELLKAYHKMIGG